MFHFIFPCNPLAPRAPEELFLGQFDALSAAGFSASLLPDSDLRNPVRLRNIPPNSCVVYRGWMLTKSEYENLVQSISAAHTRPFIKTSEYLIAHHLPNWYPAISDFTPETKSFESDADLAPELKKLDWGSFFIKDYVKSLKTSVGSLISDPNQISEVIKEMIAFRGEIEGGICVRRVEPFITSTEKRYFVINGTAYAAEETAQIPKIVFECAQRIKSKFFSVDIIERNDGVLRVVEIGDGQVSDLVGWAPERFAKIWQLEARNCTTVKGQC